MSREGGFGESQENRSQVDLDPASAKALPMLLDYMYGKELEGLHTDNAVPLLHLANYFGVPAAFYAVQSFIQRDLKLGTAPTYLDGATAYGFEKLEAAAVKAARGNSWCETEVEAASALHEADSSRGGDLAHSPVTEARRRARQDSYEGQEVASI